MEKGIFRSLVTGLTMMGALAFADSQDPNTYMQSRTPANNGMISDSQMVKNGSVLMDKEGWIELGADLLIMTSSLTTTFSNETIILSPIPPNVVFPAKQKTESINPDYNLGVEVDLRYRAPTNNDVGIYYHYIRSNGDGQDKREQTDPVSLPGILNTVQYDNKGHVHSHMHIVDFLFGRTFPISSQSTIHFLGGLCFQNLHFFEQFSLSRRDRTTSNGVVTSDVTNTVGATQRNHMWFLGPKVGLNFEYWFFPKTWTSDLNLFLETQFSVLYTKEWSNGERTIRTATLTTDTSQTVDWRNRPKFEFVPNINLDVGMRYRYHFENEVKLVFAFGYKVFAYWHMEEVSRISSYQGGEEGTFVVGTPYVDDLFTYTGPYVRFSLAY